MKCTKLKVLYKCIDRFKFPNYFLGKTRKGDVKLEIEEGDVVLGEFLIKKCTRIYVKNVGQLSKREQRKLNDYIILR